MNTLTEILTFLIIIATVVFWIWSLVDCLKYKWKNPNNKIVWVLVILLSGVFGSLLYVLIAPKRKVKPNKKMSGQHEDFIEKHENFVEKINNYLIESINKIVKLFGEFMEKISTNKTRKDMVLRYFLYSLTTMEQFIFSFKKVVNDREIDALLEEDIKILILKSLKKLDIDPSKVIRNPEIVIGPRLWNIGDVRVLYKKGEDGFLRFTPIDVNIIYCGEIQLFIYSCILDLLTGAIYNETTEELFYENIVSVSTKIENSIVVQLANKKSKNNESVSFELHSVEVFSITTSAGNSISVILSSPDLATYMGGGIFPTERAEKALRSIREVLRDKKSNLSKISNAEQKIYMPE